MVEVTAPSSLVDIARKTEARAFQRCVERWTRKAVSVVVGDAECRAGVEREIVGLAWMSLRREIGQRGAVGHKAVDIGGLTAAGDLVVVVILFDNDHDMAVVRYAGGGGRIDLQGAGGIVVGGARQVGGVAGAIADDCAVEVQRRDGEIGRGLARGHRIAEAECVAS